MAATIGYTRHHVPPANTPRPTGHHSAIHRVGPPPSPVRECHPCPTGHHSAGHRVDPPPCPTGERRPRPAGHHDAILRVKPPPRPNSGAASVTAGHGGAASGLAPNEGGHRGGTPIKVDRSMSRPQTPSTPPGHGVGFERLAATMSHSRMPSVANGTTRRHPRVGPPQCPARKCHPCPTGHHCAGHRVHPPPCPTGERRRRPAGHHGGIHRVDPPSRPARECQPYPTGHHGGIPRVGPPPCPDLECRPCLTGHSGGIRAGWGFDIGASWWSPGHQLARQVVMPRSVQARAPLSSAPSIQARPRVEVASPAKATRPSISGVRVSGPISTDCPGR